MTLPVDDARAVFERRVRAWLAQDMDAYMACWHDDMVITMPGRVVEGAARYRGLVEAGFAWATPISFDIHHLAVEPGTHVVLSDWSILARRSEDGVVVGWSGLAVCELRDGRIAWWRECYDRPPAPVSERRG